MRYILHKEVKVFLDDEPIATFINETDACNWILEDGEEGKEYELKTFITKGSKY